MRVVFVAWLCRRRGSGGCVVSGAAARNFILELVYESWAKQRDISYIIYGLVLCV